MPAAQGGSVLQELRALAAEAPCPSPPTENPHSKGEPVPQAPREGLERGLEPESRGREASSQKSPRLTGLGCCRSQRGRRGAPGQAGVAGVSGGEVQVRSPPRVSNSTQDSGNPGPGDLTKTLHPRGRHIPMSQEPTLGVAGEQ